MTTRTFTNAPESVRAARRFAQEQLAGVDEAVVEVVLVMVSELATNCVRYTTTPFTVSVDGLPAEVRVVVTDAGRGQPVLRSPSPREPSGRGLRIVEAFADDWGILPVRATGGKSVWFTVANRAA